MDGARRRPPVRLSRFGRSVRFHLARLLGLKSSDIAVPSRKGILRTIAAVHHQGNQAVVTSLTRCFPSGDPPPAMLRRSNTWRRLAYAMIRILSPPRFVSGPRSRLRPANSDTRNLMPKESAAHPGQPNVESLEAAMLPSS